MKIITYSNIRNLIDISIVALTVKEIIVGKLAGIAIGYLATLYIGQNFCSILFAASIATGSESSLGILLGSLLVITRILPIRDNSSWKKEETRRIRIN